MYSNIYGGLLTENIFTFDSLGAHTGIKKPKEIPDFRKKENNDSPF